jgi:hypothetical protein
MTLKCKAKCKHANIITQTVYHFLDFITIRGIISQLVKCNGVGIAVLAAVITESSITMCRPLKVNGRLGGTFIAFCLVLCWFLN